MTECIILAAGTSSRMNSWKLFLPFRGRPVIDHVLDAAAQSCDRVIIVSGFRSAALKEHLGRRDDRCIFCTNTGFERGMFSSIQTAAYHSRGDLLFITHADLPLTSAGTFGSLLELKAGTCSDEEILQPVYEGKPGHPVLMEGSVRKTILSLDSSASMREVFAQHRVRRIPWEDPSVISDIDTPEAYHRLISLR